VTALSATLELEASEALAVVDQIEAGLSAAVDSFGVGLSQAIDSVTGEDVVVGVETDTSSVQSEIDDAVASATPEPVEIEVDTTAAQADVGALADSTSELGGSISSLGGDVGSGTGALDDFAGSAFGAGNAAGLASKGGIAALALGMGASINAAGEAALTLDQFDQILENTNGNAGVTSAQIQTLATDIQQYSGLSDEAVISGAAVVAMFENVRDVAGEPIFTRVIEDSADLARSPAFNGDVTAAARTLGRAVDDPVKGLGRLRRAGIQLTESQEAQITALQESGDLIGAQGALLDIIEGKVGNLAETYGDSLPGQVDKAQEALGEFGEEIGSNTLPGVIDLLGGVTDLTTALSDLNNLDLSDLAGAIGRIGSSRYLGAIGLVVDGISAVGDQLESEDFTDLLSEEELTRLGLAKNVMDEFGKGAGDAGEEVAAAAEDAVSLDDAISDLTQSIDDYLSATFDVPDAQQELRQSFAEVTESMDTGTWDDQANALEGVVRSTADVISAQQEQGASQGELDSTVFTSIATLAQMRDAGVITGAQFDTLSQQIADVPHESVTRVSAPGASEANRQLQIVKTTIDGIDTDVIVRVSVPNLGAIAADVAGAAAALRSLRDVEAFDIGVTGAAANTGGSPINAPVSVNINGSVTADDAAAIGEAVGDSVASRLQELHIRSEWRLAR
jgi:hypothetical protein